MCDLPSYVTHDMIAKQLGVSQSVWVKFFAGDRRIRGENETIISDGIERLKQDPSIWPTMLWDEEEEEIKEEVEPPKAKKQKRKMTAAAVPPPKASTVVAHRLNTMKLLDEFMRYELKTLTMRVESDGAVYFNAEF